MINMMIIYLFAPINVRAPDAALTGLARAALGRKKMTVEIAYDVTDGGKMETVSAVRIPKSCGGETIKHEESAGFGKAFPEGTTQKAPLAERRSDMFCRSFAGLLGRNLLRQNRRAAEGGATGRSGREASDRPGIGRQATGRKN